MPILFEDYYIRVWADPSKDAPLKAHAWCIQIQRKQGERTDNPEALQLESAISGMAYAWARERETAAAAVAAERERCAVLCEQMAAGCEKEAARGRDSGRPWKWEALALRQAAGEIRQG